MRLFEFADAKEQIALWKLVSDAVWSSIKKQEREQAEAEMYKASQAKTKTRATRKPKKAPKFTPPPKTQQVIQTKNPNQLNQTSKTQADQATQYPQKAPLNKLQQPQNAQDIQRQLTTQKMRSRLVQPASLNTKTPSTFS